MVGRDIILIDGLLYQPHAGWPGVKGQILPRLRRDRGQMMNSGQKTGAAIWAFSGIM
jgi:hypothetical protein